MGEVMTTVATDETVGVFDSPFLSSSATPTETFVPEGPKRAALSMDELLQFDMVDDLGSMDFGSHRPFSVASEILSDAQAIRYDAIELFDGCASETALDIDARFVALRKSLADFAESFESDSPLHILDDRELLEKLATGEQRFLKRAQQREPELVQARELFVERVRYAIDNQGLPLTHEQLEARLDGIRIGFSHPLNSAANTVAQYDAVEHHAFIDIDRLPDEVLVNVFHELFHAISGIDLRADGESYRKLGLMYAGGQDVASGRIAGLRRLWLNEAVTDILVDIMLDEDGELWDFGSDSSSLYFARDEDSSLLSFFPMSRARQSGYRNHKFAMLDATRAVPTRVLLEAYLGRNNDVHTKDQRAGTHAERELQRAFKRTGGVQRVKQLRLIDRQFQKSQHVVTGPSAVDAGLRMAREIAEEGTVRVAASEENRQEFERVVNVRTEFRNAKIAEAKLWVASRGRI
jgi:hypothetical protein